MNHRRPLDREPSRWDRLLHERSRLEGPDRERRAGRRVLRLRDLDEADRAELRDRFRRDVLPVLTPMALDRGHAFPRLADPGLALVVEADAPTGAPIRSASVRIVPLPLGAVARLQPLRARLGEPAFVLLEDLVRLHVAELLGSPVARCSVIRVTGTAGRVRLVHEEGLSAAARAALLARLGQRGTVVPISLVGDMVNGA